MSEKIYTSTKDLGSAHYNYGAFLGENIENFKYRVKK